MGRQVTITATQSSSSALFMSTARLDTQNYRRSVMIEELMSSLDELCRESQRGESHENRLRAQRKHMAPTLARVVAYLERQ